MAIPESQFKGESAFGLDNKNKIALHKLSKVQSGVHSSYNASKHISPVSQWIFGWNIFD